VPLGARGLSIDALRETVARTAPRVIYLVPTCHNPTGAIMDEAARRGVGEIADGSGAVVVEDLTLADLALERRPPAPIAQFARRGTVLTVGSLSKLFWGGLRVGWIRGPAAAITRLSRLKVVSDLSGSLVSEAIGVRVLARAEELAEARRRQVRERLATMMRLMAKHLPKWSYLRPSGGLSLWVRLPAGDVEELRTIALRRGVAIVPGTVNSPEGRWRDHLRLPYVAEAAVLEAGVRRLAEAWDEYAPRERGKGRGMGVLV
jgi:DNA-binding transcriptional MocR family regulator